MRNEWEYSNLSSLSSQVGAFITATEDVVEQQRLRQKEEEEMQSWNEGVRRGLSACLLVMFCASYIPLWPQVLMNYYKTHKPENADRRKVRRFMMLFKGNMAKVGVYEHECHREGVRKQAR